MLISTQGQFSIKANEQRLYFELTQVELDTLGQFIDEFARISPIAWSHIAFTGKYNLIKSNGDIDVDAMVNELEKHLKWYFWKVA